MGVNGVGLSALMLGEASGHVQMRALLQRQVHCLNLDLQPCDCLKEDKTKDKTITTTVLIKVRV